MSRSRSGTPAPSDDPGAPDGPAPAVLLDLAREAALEAAALVREHREHPVAVADTKSSDVDVVTETDRAAEALIRDRLLGARPGDGFVGEESAAQPPDSGSGRVRWVVDPIDGTVNFVYGIPQYSVCVAAELDGRMVAGVVANVATGACYTATLGGGAHCDGQELRPRPRAVLSHRLVLTGFNYDASVRGVQAAATARLLPRVRDIRRMGSAALDLCAVASGNADGYVEEGLHLWDHAAAGLVATEAGCSLLVTTGASGLRAVVCAPADGFEELLDLVRSCGFLRAGPGAEETSEGE